MIMECPYGKQAAEDFNAHSPSSTPPRLAQRTRDGRHDPYSARVLESPTMSESTSTNLSFNDSMNVLSLKEYVGTSPGESLKSDSYTPVAGLANSLPSTRAFHPDSSSTYFPTARTPMGVPSQVVHRHIRNQPARNAHMALADSCSFVWIPAGHDQEVVEDTTALEALLQLGTLPRPLFIGQCRFETTAGELMWLLKNLVGVHPLKIEPRGPGCFVAVVPDERSVERLLMLNRTILFDHGGVWWARDANGAAFLDTYVSNCSPQYSRRARLPRDTMIVERQRGSLDPLRSLGGFHSK